jgi:chromosome segregation ATPase
MEATESSFIKPDLLRSLSSCNSFRDIEKPLKDLFKSAFITNCALDDASVTDEELQTLEELDNSELIENLKSLLDTLLTFKSNCKSSNSGELATRCDQLEKMLQKQESEVRNHIKAQHQLKLHIDNLQQKISELEKNNIEAKASIKEMEDKGLETMQSKLQKIEQRFQSELNKVVKDYRDEFKKTEKIKKLEEMYEKKEKAFIKLQQDYFKVKQKLEEIVGEKVRSVSDEKFKIRRSSFNEDFYKVQNIGNVFAKEVCKTKKEKDRKFSFRPPEKVLEPVPPPLELKQASVVKIHSYSSRRHLRSSSDSGRPISTKKFKIKR